MLILIALLVIPVIEIALFIELGGALGLWPTIGLVFLTAIIGAGLVRAQGFNAMQKMQVAVDAGEDPRGPIAEGVMILFAGLMLITPGFFTDAAGFALLIPPVRLWLIKRIGPAIAARRVHMNAAGERSRPASEEVIDIDYQDVTDENNSGDKPKSGWTQPH